MVCEHCKGEFEARRRDQRFCKQICRSRWSYQVNREMHKAARRASYHKYKHGAVKKIDSSVPEKPTIFSTLDFA